MGRAQPVGKRLYFLFRIVIERRLSPSKRTEKTWLEHVGLTASCPSVTGHERSNREARLTGSHMLIGDIWGISRKSLLDTIK